MSLNILPYKHIQFFVGKYAKNEITLFLHGKSDPLDGHKCCRNLFTIHEYALGPCPDMKMAGPYRCLRGNIFYAR